MAALKERLRAFLGLDTKEFERGLDRSNQKVKTFGERASQGLGSVMSKASGLGTAFLGGIAGGVVGAALSGVTSNLTDMVKSVASVGDEAKRAGLGLRVFQEWRYVAEQSRVGVDQMVDGFKELSMRADEWIATGGGAAADAFQRLGYSAEDLKVKLKDPSELMLEIIGRMRQLDAAARLRVSDEIFGGALAEQFGQLVERGTDGVRALIGEAHTAGAVLDEQLIRRAQVIDERFAAMTQRFSSWGKALAVALIDLPFNAIETRLDEIFPDEAFGRSVLGDEVYDELARLSAMTDAQTASVEQLSAVHRALGDEARSAAAAMLMDLNQVPSSLAEQRTQLAGISEEMRTATAEFETGAISAEEFAKRIADAQSAAAVLFGTLQADSDITLSNAISAVARLATKIGEAAAQARALKAALPGGVAKEVPGYLDNAEGPGWEPDSGAPSARPRRAPNDAFWEALVTTGSSGGGGGGGAKPVDDWQRTLEQIKGQTDALNAEAASLAAAALGGQEYGDALEYARRRADLLYAAQQAGKEITPELTAQIDQLAAAYVTAAVSADDAADRLREVEENGRRGADAISGIFMSVLSGSKGAKQAVADLLMEMAKVQARRAFLGMAGSGGGVMGFIGGLLGGARAKGGPVAAGVPYLVNENTPNSEIFVPGTGGAVLTVQQAQAALGRNATGGVSALAGGVPGDKGGVTSVQVSLSPELVGQILHQAGQQSVQIVQANNRNLPTQIEAHNTNRRRR